MLILSKREADIATPVDVKKNHCSYWLRLLGIYRQAMVSRVRYPRNGHGSLGMTFLISATVTLA